MRKISLVSDNKKSLPALFLFPSTYFRKSLEAQRGATATPSIQSHSEYSDHI